MIITETYNNIWILLYIDIYAVVVNYLNETLI